MCSTSISHYRLRRNAIHNSWQNAEQIRYFSQNLFRIQELIHVFHVLRHSLLLNKRATAEDSSH